MDHSAELAPTSLVDVLFWRAENQPEQLAFMFLEKNEREGPRLTYLELDRKARSLAHEVTQQSPPGSRALLLYPPGLDFVCAFYACLYGEIIAVPVPPPNPNRIERTLPRLTGIVEDAQPEVVLTTTEIHQAVVEYLPKAPKLQQVKWVTTDNMQENTVLDWHQQKLPSDKIAFLQYTSGSTSAPKGVMISHQNLLHHAGYVSAAWRYQEDSKSITWMPHFHDYSLIEGIVHPVYRGIPSFLMAPLAFLMQPGLWLKAISHHRITNSAGPNFAYELCLRKSKDRDLQGLDLSCWRNAGNAAEPVREETMRNFHQRFAPYGFEWQTFCPSYGLAEATLVVTAATESGPLFSRVEESKLKQEHQAVEASSDQAGTMVIPGCGKPVMGMDIKIVSPQTKDVCPEKSVGEIWVADPSVARGYWNNPEATEETFGAKTQDGQGPYLRTGDLGFLFENELYVTGRIKDVIIIAGENHYPQDIEWRVQECHPAIRLGCCAAFAIDHDQQERLVVVAEIDKEYKKKQGSVDLRAVTKAVRQIVAECFDIQVHKVVLIEHGAISKTSSGKIQRQACKQRFLANTLPVEG